MSWNTLLAFVEHLNPEQVLALLPEYTVQARALAFEAASSVTLDGVALAGTPGWTVLCSPLDEPFPGEAFLTRASAGGRALLLTLAGTGGVYGFSLFAGGEHVREVVYADFELVEEQGAPLPQEPAGSEYQEFGHQEDWLFGLMEALTGLTLNTLAALEYQVVQTPETALAKVEGG